ncbi:hypothetical protein LSAT2_001432 [Lamellibrachia satsuma]|nr:hypothetical protein LSAT2_001432 [Lamellibrachia satsuma]
MPGSVAPYERALVVYVTHSCGFLSTWGVVTFTLERYVKVFHPHRRDTFCTKRRAQMIVASLVLFACVVNAYTILSYDVIDFGFVTICLPKPGYHNVVMMMMTCIDTAVSCLVPSTVCRRLQCAPHTQGAPLPR